MGNCYYNKFTSLKDVLDYLDREDDKLHNYLNSITLKLTANNQADSVKLLEKDSSIKNIKNSLFELQQFLYKLDYEFTSTGKINTHIYNEIFIKLQGHILYFYDEIKSDNFPKIVYNKIT